MQDNTFTLIRDGQVHELTLGPDVLEDLRHPDPDDFRDLDSRIFDELMALCPDDPDAPVPAATSIAFLAYPMGT